MQFPSLISLIEHHKGLSILSPDDTASQKIVLYIVEPASQERFIKQLSLRDQNWLEANQYRFKAGSTIALSDTDGHLSSAILAVGDTPQWDAAQAVSTLPQAHYIPVLDYAPDTPLSEIQLGWQLAHYHFAPHKPDTDTPARPQLTLKPDQSDVSIEALVRGSYLTREMINLPANIMTPEGIEKSCEQIASAYGAEITITSGEALKSYGPAVHIVGRAAEIQPRVIDMRWGDTGPVITLVGKGISFDSGGLDIKPSRGMELMKKDMGGAAHVLGLALAIMHAGLEVRLRVLIGAAENAISEKAMRPLDIIKTAAGIDVEVGNTDAEGRLVLADLLYHACHDTRHGTPDFLLDFATLTGAARVALGTECPAVFANHDRTARAFVDAGFAIDDPLWHMPLLERYDRQLDTGQAGLSSTGPSGYGGAITAALFLRRFVGKEINWAHIDVMAWNLSSKAGRPKGGEAMGLRAAYALIASQQYAQR